MLVWENLVSCQLVASKKGTKRLPNRQIITYRVDKMDYDFSPI
jgi:hypothetical protein